MTESSRGPEGSSAYSANDHDESEEVVTTAQNSGAVWPAPFTALVLRLAEWLLARHTKAGRWQPVQGEREYMVASAERAETQLFRQLREGGPSPHLTASDGRCRTKGHFH